ncbi:MAG: hypothetical protein P0Y53_09585 [Candidatus Pseudobacter hemicellulosilyticus]|uniref:Uncharacterized protein n=1 Tax=Candidatus Pseudobacter hemicellulosilyticus TaxID=3121375 RepID=A0AAJ5WYE1_9BACT|nr:MAG: hypothetical protein P0Y53_09585 [Pseudobacter sp.]
MTTMDKIIDVLASKEFFLCSQLGMGYIFLITETIRRRKEKKEARRLEEKQVTQRKPYC